MVKILNRLTRLELHVIHEDSILVPCRTWSPIQIQSYYQGILCQKTEVVIIYLLTYNFNYKTQVVRLKYLMS